MCTHGSGFVSGIAPERRGIGGGGDRGGFWGGVGEGGIGGRIGEGGVYGGLGVFWGGFK